MMTLLLYQTFSEKEIEKVFPQNILYIFSLFDRNGLNEEKINIKKKI